jgi:predicted transcriptional regulator
MKLVISIRSSDTKVASEIAEAKIADGITIQQYLILREIVNPPIDFFFYIGEHIALPIAASLIAKLLYDKLKERKDNKLMINNKSVEINAEKIEQLIINIEKEKKGK